MNYLKLYQEFASYECNLLTTEQELQEQINNELKNRGLTIHHAKVRILAQCGHEHVCVVTNFLQRRTAIMCKDCRAKNIQRNMKTISSKENFYEIEYNGYKEIKCILEQFYQVERTKEGCRADFMIRPRDSSRNEWIGAQLKVTTKMSFKMYTFRRLSKAYDDLLMFCYCLEDNKLWIMPYFDIKNLKANLNISEYSKYNKYLVTPKSNICQIIESYKNKFKYYTKEELLVPTSAYNKQEQEYAQIRESKLPWIQFTYPEIENGKTDFFIGHLKIQEKVTSIRNNKETIVLCVHNGTIDGGRQYRSYQIGDNDFYWVHLKNSAQFYIIPEQELFKRNYISSQDSYINKVYIRIKQNQDWLYDYLFDYESLDNDKIKVLLGL